MITHTNDEVYLTSQLKSLSVNLDLQLHHRTTKD